MLLRRQKLGKGYRSKIAHVDADIVVCSSSGWAHLVRTSGRKIVYCHSPAKWLYRRDDYLGDHPSSVARLARMTEASTPGGSSWCRSDERALLRLTTAAFAAP